MGSAAAGGFATGNTGFLAQLHRMAPIPPAVQVHGLASKVGSVARESAAPAGVSWVCEVCEVLVAYDLQSEGMCQESLIASRSWSEVA